MEIIFYDKYICYNPFKIHDVMFWDYCDLRFFLFTCTILWTYDEDEQAYGNMKFSFIIFTRFIIFKKKSFLKQITSSGRNF